MKYEISLEVPDECEVVCIYPERWARPNEYLPYVLVSAWDKPSGTQVYGSSYGTSLQSACDGACTVAINRLATELAKPRPTPQPRSKSSFTPINLEELDIEL